MSSNPVCSTKENRSTEMVRAVFVFSSGKFRAKEKPHRISDGVNLPEVYGQNRIVFPKPHSPKGAGTKGKARP